MLIFFANVVYANKTLTSSTVFVLWLYLELGNDVCYLPGIDVFGKIWLQLAFPAYIILMTRMLSGTMGLSYGLMGVT